jgi:hypothetical protein
LCNFLTCEGGTKEILAATLLPPKKNCLLNLVEHQHYFWSLVNIKEQGEEISFCDPKPKWHKGGDMGFVGAHNDHQGRLRRTMRVFSSL